MIALDRSTVTPLSVDRATEAERDFRRIFGKAGNEAIIGQEKNGKVDWLTEKYLRPDTILATWANPDKFVGTRPKSTTYYWQGDVDTGSIYHPAKHGGFEKIEEIKEVLDNLGIVECETFYSSDSMGIHLYAFLPEPVPSFWLGAAIQYALEDAGFVFKAGQLEASPSLKAYSEDPKEIVQYQAFRLPMQKGGQYLEHPDDEPRSMGLVQLMDIVRASQQRQNMDVLLLAMGEAQKRRYAGIYGQKEQNKTPKAQAFAEALEARISRGFSGFGETNELMKDTLIYGYVFLEMEGEELAMWLEEAIKNAPGYAQYCRHQHEITRKAKAWVRWIEKSSKYYHYSNRAKKREVEEAEKGPTANENRHNESKGKIMGAIEYYLAEGKVFPSWRAAYEGIREWIGEVTSSRTLDKFKEAIYKILDPIVQAKKGAIDKVTPAKRLLSV